MLIYNGTEIENVIFNGTELGSVVFNGTEVWSKSGEQVTFVYTGLDENGNITTNEAEIVSYMIGDGSTEDGNGYKGTETELVIPSAYNDKPVTKIGQYAFTNKNELTSINIPSSVTTIGNHAFAECRNAEFIFDKNNKILNIGAFAFSICRGLKNIYLGEGLTRIGASAFESCGLVEITIPSSVTTIPNNVFVNCSNLLTITVAEGNTSFKTDNDRALLTADGIKLISYANNSGTTYSIPDTVTTIGSYAFSACSNLTDVKLPEGLTTIETNAFRICNSLTSITIPESLISIETYAFAYCTNLTEMTLNPTTPPTLSGTNAIPTATTTIYVPTASLEVYQTATNWSEFADIMVGFGEEQGTEGLVYTGLDESGAVTTDETAIVSYMVGDNTTTAGNAYAGDETEIVIPSTHNKKPVIQIGQYAFRNNTKITSIKIPNTITTINGRALYGCSNLTEITIPASVETIRDYAFYNLRMPINFEEGSIISTLGSYAFFNCKQLTSINLGGGIKTLPSQCIAGTGLTSITIPSTVTSISNSIYDCQNLETIIVASESSTYKTDNNRALLSKTGTVLYAYAYNSGTSYVIPSTVTTINNHVFNNCLNLTSITIPNSVKSISSSAFKGCVNLQGITIPATVTKIDGSAFASCQDVPITFEEGTKITSLGASAFYKCLGIKTIPLGEGLTAISSQTFQNSGLTNITIPSTVTNIGSQAFNGCEDLTEITLLSTTPPTLSSTSAISSYTQTIYVPSESLTAYQTATNWSNYASLMIGVEGSMGWHTVWTGSLEYSGVPVTYAEVSKTVAGVTANLPTRVSGTGKNSTSTTFTNVVLNTDDGTNGTLVVKDSSEQYMLAPTEDNTLKARVKGVFQKYGIILTEVQQYY